MGRSGMAVQLPLLAALLLLCPSAMAQGNDTTTFKEDPEICEEGGKGLWLPLFENEHEWNHGLRTFLYFIGLVWMFLGVGIVSDVFMSAIEVITAVEKKVTGPDGTEYTVKIWNETVANLTLMALGSSAPEILLNVVEICSNKFFAGDLGPSTIVGSAAFNLLIIIAVCVVAIEAPEGRKIKQMGVFAITAVCSVFAYAWLLIILLVNTPNVVDPWEALLTLAFFPVLVVFAYGADQNWWKNDSTVTPEAHLVAVGNRKFSVHAIQGLIKKAGADVSTLDDEDAQKALVSMAVGGAKRSRAQYRIDAMRQITGGKRVVPPKTRFSVTQAQLEEVAKKRAKAPENEVNVVTEELYVLEDAGHVTVGMHRAFGDGVLEVDYETIGVTATAGLDFIAENGTMTFQNGELEKSIDIKIVDDDEAEEDETFYIRLFNPRPNCRVGAFEKCTVTIIDDDEPGQLGIDDRCVQLTTSETQPHVDIIVRRRNGSLGQISCSYRTTDDTAKAGVDYQSVAGELVFKEGEITHMIQVPLINTQSYEKALQFNVELANPKGPRQAGELAEDREKSQVHIVQDDTAKKIMDDLTKLVNDDLAKYVVGTSSYADQFREAIFEVEGAEDGEPIPTSALVMHIISMPFKLIFATIPPTDFMNAYPCFFISLAYIGLVTAIIGDLAGIFGCLAGFKAEFTAITFVALGTSLPDTFASKAAAESDETADASVGNVTGSNSVNVFLGLGLPWSIASIYWWAEGINSDWTKYYGVNGLKENMVDDYPDGGFVVLADSLGFSVGIFCVCAVTCLCTLYFRRVNWGFELGGPKGPQQATFVLFVGLWCFYIFMSYLQIYGHIVL